MPAALLPVSGGELVLILMGVALILGVLWQFRDLIGTLIMFGLALAGVTLIVGLLIILLTRLGVTS